MGLGEVDDMADDGGAVIVASVVGAGAKPIED